MESSVATVHKHNDYSWRDDRVVFLRAKKLYRSPCHLSWRFRELLIGQLQQIDRVKW